MSLMTIPNDLFVAGTLTPQNFTPPAACIPDSAIPAGANVDAAKLKRRIAFGHADAFATNIATQRFVVYRCRASVGATILDFGVGASTPFGAASTATIKLLKNGVDILSADITLDNTTAAFTLKTAAGFTSTALVQGDVLEVQISAVTGANPAAGFYSAGTVDEFPN